VAYVWDHAKRDSNLVKHGLDFMDGIMLFDGRPIFTYASPRNDEDRFVTVGLVNGLMVALIWLRRDAEIRVISLRRARNGEKADYGRWNS
jgi:uncharacterized protein